jgi:hypothetical protein
MGNVRETFTNFFEAWLERQQSFLEQLLASLSSIKPSRDDEQRQLIEQVLGHYMQYYEEKSKAANDDVFLLYSPPWLSTFERTFLWMSGFRPSLVFKFVSNAVGETLSEEEQSLIRKLKAETNHEERKIEEAMASIQESVAAPPMFHLLRIVGRLVNGQVSDLDAAMEELRAAMLMIIEKSDNLRGATVWKVCEILNPEQTVKLFAGAAHFHLQTRRMGLQRDQAVAVAVAAAAESSFF